MKNDKILKQNSFKNFETPESVLKKIRKHYTNESKGKRKYTYNLVVVVGMQFQLCVMLLLLQSCSLVTWP